MASWSTSICRSPFTSRIRLKAYRLLGTIAACRFLSTVRRRGSPREFEFSLRDGALKIGACPFPAVHPIVKLEDNCRRVVDPAEDRVKPILLKAFDVDLDDKKLSGRPFARDKVCNGTDPDAAFLRVAADRLDRPLSGGIGFERHSPGRDPIAASTVEFVRTVTEPKPRIGINQYGLPRICARVRRVFRCGRVRRMLDIRSSIDLRPD